MPGTLRAVPGILLLAAMLAGCVQTIPKDALQLTEQGIELRRLQTRHFETADENKMLAAVAALIQDLGFTLDESETDLGVIVASKNRDATEAGQIALSIFVAVLTGTATPVDDTQKMRISVVTRPIGDDGGRVAVRVTFQRMVWDTQGKLSRVEGLTDPEAYQEFFAGLSKAIFLEAHEI